MNACDIISMLLAMSIVILKCYASDCVSSKLLFILEEEEASSMREENILYLVYHYPGPVLKCLHPKIENIV